MVNGQWSVRVVVVVVVEMVLWREGGLCLGCGRGRGQQQQPQQQQQQQQQLEGGEVWNVNCEWWGVWGVGGVGVRG